MLDEWRIRKGLLDGGDLAGAKSEPEEGVADDSDDWWNPKWVPLTYSGSGDHHCPDLAPTPGGEVGQIILMYHDVPTRQVVARSFGAWLEALAADLEAGRYVYYEDQYHGLVNKDEL
jgi:cell wall assembly regulator SMI1